MTRFTSRTWSMRSATLATPLMLDLSVRLGTRTQRAAESAATYLSVEERGPVALPSAEELDQGATIDHETGEVLPTDPGTGMTELDEDTARALDAGGGADAGPIDPYRGEPWAEKRRELLDRFATDATPGAVNATNKELERHMAGFPDEVQTELDEAFKAARERVKPKG